MKQFIIWDPKDGEPPRESGVLSTSGVLGILSEDNVYIRTYGVPLPDEPLPGALEVGQSMLMKFSLSMDHPKVYKVYRVEDAE